jgi:hypothetical protein
MNNIQPRRLATLYCCSCHALFLKHQVTGLFGLEGWGRDGGLTYSFVAVAEKDMAQSECALLLAQVALPPFTTTNNRQHQCRHRGSLACTSIFGGISVGENRIGILRERNRNSSSRPANQRRGSFNNNNNNERLLSLYLTNIVMHICGVVLSLAIG